MKKKNALAASSCRIAGTIPLYNRATRRSYAACVGSASIFTLETGAHLMDLKERPDYSRGRFLSQIPLGTPETKVRRVLALGSESRQRFAKYCKPSETFIGYTCTYD